MDLTKLTNALRHLETVTDDMSSAIHELDDAAENNVLLRDLDMDLSAVSDIRETLRQVPESLRKDPRHVCYFDALDKILVALESARWATL